ncbi:MAG: AraC family transcriptional regulator [Bacteroidaceae bacterium]|nr:AraC family transcriptional regulator [Bacteroidaceae bacterium]
MNFALCFNPKYSGKMKTVDVNIRENVAINSSMDEYIAMEQLSQCCETILKFLCDEKRYLNPIYSLWELSREVGISARLISNSINKVLGQNFFELLNRLRVEEAQRILINSVQHSRFICIEDIYAKSGFGSRSAFYMSFKKYTGFTPRQYMKMCEEENMNII